MQNVVNRQLIVSAETCAARRQLARYYESRRYQYLRHGKLRLQDEAFDYHNRCYSSAVARAVDLPGSKQENKEDVRPACATEDATDVRITRYFPLEENCELRRGEGGTSFDRDGRISKTQGQYNHKGPQTSPAVNAAYTPCIAGWESINHRLVSTKHEDRLSLLKQILREGGAKLGRQQVQTLNKIVQRALELKLISEDAVRNTTYELVTELLLQDPPRHAAVHLLRVDATNEGSVHLGLHAYMDWLPQKGFSSTVLVKSAARFSQALTELDIQLSVSLARKIFQCLARSEDVAAISRAHPNLIDTCDLAKNIKMVTPVVIAYAERQDWSSVDKILTHITGEQEARKQPYHFAELLSTLIRVYARHTTADQIYDFTTYYIQNFAWIATPTLGATVASYLIKRGRHDLTYSWMQHVQKTDHVWKAESFRNQLLRLLGPLWYENKASTRDILACCRLLARDQIHDPFSRASRNIIADAVAWDIAGRLMRLPTFQGTALPIEPPYDLMQLLVQARTTTDRLSKLQDDGRKSRRLQVQELSHQLTAVEELVRLLRGANVANDLRHTGEFKTETVFKYDAQAKHPPVKTAEEPHQWHAHSKSEHRPQTALEHCIRDERWNRLTAWSMNPRQAAISEFPF